MIPPMYQFFIGGESSLKPQLGLRKREARAFLDKLGSSVTPGDHEDRSESQGQHEVEDKKTVLMK